MTVTDRTAATDEEFRARFDRFGIFDEERVVEEVARAIASEAIGVTLVTDDEWDFYLRPDEQAEYRRLAAAAVAAYRAQDGGAEEAVRRVEVLAEKWAAGDFVSHGYARDLRRALAPQAVGTGQ